MDTAEDEDGWIIVSPSKRQYSPSLKVHKTLDPGLPRDNPTEAAWQIPPDPLLQHFRSTEHLPTGLLDVVIIGSGLSGTSVAWHLLHGDGQPRKKYLSTLMLEARDVCSGATGRNGLPSSDKADLGGHLSCDFFSFYSEVMSMYDEKQAASRSWFEKLNFDSITELVRRRGIECELEDNGGGWHVYLTEEAFARGKRDLEGMKAAGGYVSSLKIFQGKQAAKVSSHGSRLIEGGWSQVLHWGYTYPRTRVDKTLQSRYGVTSDINQRTFVAVAHENTGNLNNASIWKERLLHHTYAAREH